VYPQAERPGGNFGWRFVFADPLLSEFRKLLSNFLKTKGEIGGQGARSGVNQSEREVDQSVSP
jgi:hypothetical protein